jgi:hypothetical protein
MSAVGDKAEGRKPRPPICYRNAGFAFSASVG